MKKNYKITNEDLKMIELKQLEHEIINDSSLIRMIKRFFGKLTRKLMEKKYIENELGQMAEILQKEKTDRLIFWISEIGWNIPLFQRPQHLFRCFTKLGNTTSFYQNSPNIDGNNYLIKKQEDGIYLINLFGIFKYKILKSIGSSYKKEKYLYIPSTSTISSVKDIKRYKKYGFKIVYDYIDDLSPALNNTKELDKNIREVHDYVLKDENILVICTATILFEDSKTKRGNDKNIIFANNAVDYEHFTQLTKKVKFTKDFEKIIASKKPIVGYYGAIASWFDYDTMIKVAKQLRDINFVMIGPEYDESINSTQIKELENIYFLGSKSFDDLPYYAEKFDMFTLPFLINEITKATNPIKIFEYMAMEKPIITSDLPECRKYESCLIYKNHKEFVKLIKDNIGNNDLKYKKILKKEALENTWEQKAKTIIDKIKQMEDLNG